MPFVRLDPARSVLMVVDVQDSLVRVIPNANELLARIRFLVEVANLIGVPVLSTEQNPNRMGPTVKTLSELMKGPIPKMTFSAGRSGEVMAGLRTCARDQVVLIGVETHICISLTAQDLMATGFEVVVCPDGVSSRTLERHKLGMERIRDAGVVPAHTEGVAYEWLASADHPLFREALGIVKRYGPDSS